MSVNNFPDIKFTSLNVLNGKRCDLLMCMTGLLLLLVAILLASMYLHGTVLKISAVLWCNMSYFMRAIFMSPTIIQSFFSFPVINNSCNIILYTVTKMVNISFWTSINNTDQECFIIGICNFKPQIFHFYCIRIYNFQVFSFSSFILIFDKKGNPSNMCICW